MKQYKSYIVGVWIFMVAFLLHSCNTYSFRKDYQNANTLLHTEDVATMHLFLKAHLKNGDLYIFSNQWSIDTIGNQVTGLATLYDFNRKKISFGAAAIAIDSVAIFETNKALVGAEDDRIAATTVLLTMDLVMTMFCISNPKACFGSCPTFYLNESDHFHYADAEGFSNAISPSLAYADIDALQQPEIKDGKFTLTMKNEAMETHCVRAANMLAIPIKDGETIYHGTDNQFYKSTQQYPLQNAEGPEGNIGFLFSMPDRQERFSLADKNNLASKETIYLDFDITHPEDDLGLLVHFRQTLMTTYFIYNAIGYMGNEASDLFAKAESNKTTIDKLEGGLKSVLGNIDVYALNEQNQQWEFQGGFYETGPIAINKQLLPLSCKLNKHAKLKLIINKGLWRIDYVALANITAQVNPICIKPSKVEQFDTKTSKTRQGLTTSNNILISMPGNAFHLTYQLPESNVQYAFFLQSEGYYLEWIRASWLKDKNLWKLSNLINHPRRYLKEEAKNYKRYEQEMEREFWNSKIELKPITFYAH